MVETAKRRRRWRCVVLAVLLLSVGTSVAWRLRPLTETERRLLGTWLWEEARMEFKFTSDRRFSRRVHGEVLEHGNWPASNGEVFFHSVDYAGPLTTSTLHLHVRRLINPEPTHVRKVEFLPRPGRMVWTRDLDASRIGLIRLADGLEN